MGTYVMTQEEKLSYLMPSKKEQEFNARVLVDKNLKCEEIIIVDFGAGELLGESPSEYCCQKCGGSCGGRFAGNPHCVKES